MPVRVAKGNLALISATPEESARSAADTLRVTLGRAFHLFPAVTIWLVMLIPHSAIGFTSSHENTDTVHMKNGDKGVRWQGDLSSQIVPTAPLSAGSATQSNETTRILD
jgi:hypothetical protein